MKKNLVKTAVGISLAAAVTCGCVYGFAQQENGGLSLADGGEVSVSEVSMADRVEDSSSDFSYGNVADVTEAVMPSVVAITNSSVQQVRDWFSRRAYEYESKSAGSGIILGSNDEELLICTNNHVVDGASNLTVSFIDDTSVEAKVKGTDPENDLAVVAVELEDIPDETMDKIRIANVGDSDSMRVGEQVVAIGNALGYGQSVTTGIISAKNRSISVQENYYEVTEYTDLIQTDTAINPGNSGGALLNMNGEVIGINSAKASSNGVEGMGYAIPVSKAMPILENLMNRKTRTLVDESKIGFMGISGEGVSVEATQLYGVPAGIYVAAVGDGTPAEEAGLQVSDIITAFDGEKVTSMTQLQDLLRYYEAGETVELTVQTAAEGAYTEETLTMTLGSREDYQS